MRERKHPGFSFTVIHPVHVEDVTLYPDTAHLYLILSQDGKSARRTDTRQDLPDNPERIRPWFVVEKGEIRLSQRQ
ncbi:hypothetical protein Y1Q_0002453 [Alligator mississippiensis]|uniref:SPRY-associated domain-containing protein n=1 Tax=Alligator mississippiensis TaxID=8496 RepID=A0A151NEG6_ALLMI|nr:hypothetical protein Y1Q_0002453 [Alligator mississippiensis]